MDAIGQAGRRNTFKLVYPGKNTGTNKVDPAASFLAGMVAYINPTTGLVEVALGTGSVVDPIGPDQPGRPLGIFGDTRTTTSRSVQTDTVIAPNPLGPVNLSKTKVFAFVEGVNFSIFNKTTGLQVPSALGTTVIAGAPGSTNFDKGIIDLVGATAITAGDELEVTYYYLNDRHGYPSAINELAPQSPVTVWKSQGTYETTLYEMADDGASGFRLPQINDLLYVSANGFLTPVPINGTSQAIATVRRGPSINNPFMEFDLAI